MTAPRSAASAVAKPTTMIQLLRAVALLPLMLQSTVFARPQESQASTGGVVAPDSPLSSPFVATVAPSAAPPAPPPGEVPSSTLLSAPPPPAAPPLGPASSSVAPAAAPPATTTEAPATTPTSSALTTVVSIFYINTRIFDGLPYSLYHRDFGSVLGVDATATTFVFTTTRIMPTGTSTVRSPGNATNSAVGAAAADESGTLSTPPSPAPTSSVRNPYSFPTSMFRMFNATGQASTVTQGPSTFAYTGRAWGFNAGPPGASNSASSAGASVPGYTVVNRCSLNGTHSARCNMTHVGAEWYTAVQAWNGSYWTYSYNWTSGDRFGFSPVTITAGVEKLPPPGAQSTSSSGALRQRAPPIAAPEALVTRLLAGVVLVGALAAGAAVVL